MAHPSTPRPTVYDMGMRDRKRSAAYQSAGGKGILNTARACGLGTGTVQRLKQEVAAA